MMALKFDPIEYTKLLRSVGVSQDQADVQAQAIEKVINNLVESQDLVTKKDLAELKLELIKWILGTGVGTVLALVGIVKFIH
jgi:acid phosphatase family membrane protein YuiD